MALAGAWADADADGDADAETPARRRPAGAGGAGAGAGRRSVRWQRVTGGRLWMCNVKRRRARQRRAEAAVRRFLVGQAQGEGESRAGHAPSAPHPAAAQAAAFKTELRASLKRLRSQLKDESDTQLSEASTASTVGETDVPTPASEFSATSADVPASPLEEICESVWDAVTTKAMQADSNFDMSNAHARASDVKPRRKDLPARSGCVAIDCEMVGVGRSKSRSILARVAVVDEHGTCLLDSYVRPTETVTDYRTRWSGIRARDLVGAPSFDSVRQRVAQLIRGKILVGHAIHNDLNVLNIAHPPALIRDTAFYPGLRRALVQASPDKYDASHCPSLKNLCRFILELSIQSGEHCPVEDAASTMKLYVRFRGDWEAGLLFS